MTLFFGVCTFVCVAFALIGCVVKVEIEEKYDKFYARSLFSELKHGEITFKKYERLLKEFGIEQYRIDTGKPPIDHEEAYLNLKRNIEEER